MAGLPAAHRIALSALIDGASDGVLANLVKAMATLPGARADALRLMLAEQTRDRARRAKVLGPLTPLFRQRVDGVAATTFPKSLLPRLWAAARDREPGLSSVLDERDHPQTRAVADRLCAAAAAAVRDQPDVIWPEGLDADRRQVGLSDLAAALDLTPVVRRGLPSLQSWVKRPDEDQIAALRLMLRDCAEIHPDGARRAFDILFAHLEDAVLVLRILSQASEGAAREDFLGQTELADFVDRLMAAIGARVDRIVAFKPARDLGQIGAVIADLDWCGAVLAELDISLKLDRDGSWGKQSRAARVTLSGHIATFLSAADKAASRTFPMENARVAGRMTRKRPVLTASVDGDEPQAALTLLRLVGALRGPAAVFGVEAARAAVVETLTGRLSDWTDAALHELDDVDDEERANGLRLIDLTAEGLTAIGADQAARTVRRRVTVARGRQRTAGASSQAA